MVFTLSSHELFKLKFVFVAYVHHSKRRRRGITQTILATYISHQYLLIVWPIMGLEKNEAIEKKRKMRWVGNFLVYIKCHTMKNSQPLWFFSFTSFVLILISCQTAFWNYISMSHYIIYFILLTIKTSYL